MKSIRLFFRIFSFLSPTLAALAAFELFQRPHQKKTRSRELELYTRYSERRIPCDPEPILLYENGPPDGYPVVLVHGWESNAGSMLAIADALVERQFRVLVLGLPAHGRSALRKTNMVMASRYIRILLESENLNAGFSMITHSFGSGASALALRGTSIKPDHLFFLTSPDRICDIFSGFAHQIGLGKAAAGKLILRTERFVPFRMEAFNISDFVSEIQWDKLTLMQDINDQVLPWANAQSIREKNPTIELIPLKDKGHYRILWDREVIGLILDRLP